MASDRFHAHLGSSECVGTDNTGICYVGTSKIEFCTEKFQKKGINLMFRRDQEDDHGFS